MLWKVGFLGHFLTFSFSFINEQTVKAGINFNINFNHLITENHEANVYIAQIWHSFLHSCVNMHKSETKMTASILKQDANTKKVQKI